ncbi:hypothetical protein LAZ67_18000958 [Cordylochernes scorpioides]|uniref:Uncharacterized protein n=1 Tax=Cordylochernes scorpioides TaxID=51811 RepID=A0ABY6LI42_9ARAC|nr:hypothetical protein LAZ67_18000958 [Cordylochernes scorpioides]
MVTLGRTLETLVEENRNHTHRVDNIKDGIVLRGTATAFQRLTTRTARRMLERSRLAALPITQMLARWLPHVSIPISISWPSLRRGAFSGHNHLAQFLSIYKCLQILRVGYMFSPYLPPSVSSSTEDVPDGETHSVTSLRSSSTNAIVAGSR